jgi:hypothetical protein
MQQQARKLNLPHLFSVLIGPNYNARVNRTASSYRNQVRWFYGIHKQYIGFNSIHSEIGCGASEEVPLHVIKTTCKPILCYDIIGICYTRFCKKI